MERRLDPISTCGFGCRQLYQTFQSVWIRRLFCHVTRIFRCVHDHLRFRFSDMGSCLRSWTFSIALQMDWCLKAFLSYFFLRLKHAYCFSGLFWQYNRLSSGWATSIFCCQGLQLQVLGFISMHSLDVSLVLHSITLPTSSEVSACYMVFTSMECDEVIYDKVYINMWWGKSSPLLQAVFEGHLHVFFCI